MLLNNNKNKSKHKHKNKAGIISKDNCIDNDVSMNTGYKTPTKNKIKRPPRLHHSYSKLPRKNSIKNCQKIRDLTTNEYKKLANKSWAKYISKKRKETNKNDINKCAKNMDCDA